MVERLGSEDYTTREHATRELRKRPEAEGLLLLARHSDDLEVRKRVTRILSELDRSRFERVIRSRTQAIVAGRVDLVPDLLEFTHPHDRGERITGALAILTSDAVSRARELGRDYEQVQRGDPSFWTGESPVTIPLPANRPVDSRVYHLGDQVTVDMHLWPFGVRKAHVRGRVVNMPDLIQDSLLAGCEMVRPGRRTAVIKRCVLVSGGDFRYQRTVAESVIFSDGTIQLDRGCTGCLVVARKGLIAEAYGYRKNKMMPGEVRILGDQSLGIVDSPTKRPLGLIRFFEVSDVGLTLDACKVTKVIGPLAKAGVKPGDVFTHIDGVAVRDAEALRKALRRRYAILGYGAFTLTREGKPLTVVAELGE